MGLNTCWRRRPRKKVKNNLLNNNLRFVFWVRVQVAVEIFGGQRRTKWPGACPRPSKRSLYETSQEPSLRALDNQIDCTRRGCLEIVQALITGGQRLVFALLGWNH